MAAESTGIGPAADLTAESAADVATWPAADLAAEPAADVATRAVLAMGSMTAKGVLGGQGHGPGSKAEVLADVLRVRIVAPVSAV